MNRHGGLAPADFKSAASAQFRHAGTLVAIIIYNMKKVNIIVFLLLLFFFIISVTSMWNDSANYDERIHLPAGYSYLTQKDMRINPEHPPLVKDLAALPLLFMKINFPHQSGGWNTALTADNSRTPSWQTDVEFGNDLLYYSENDAQNMIRLGRVLIILIGVLLGFYVWRFTKELWGNLTGIMALAFYSFSPTILAHTRLVTTDIAAAAAFFISFYYLYKWLKFPKTRSILVFSIIFSLSLLTKFSTVLLLPIFGVIVLVWALISPFERSPERRQNQEKWFWAKKYIGGFIFALVIAYLIVGAVYAYHVWNYPAQKQAIDTAFILSTLKFKSLANLNIWISSQPILRTWGHYILGVLMNLERSAGGNTTYFLGQISASGSRLYFPVVYLLKEPLPYILLALFALFLALKKLFDYCGGRLKKQWLYDFVELLKNNITEFGMIFTIFVYWLFSINSNLNIGVRHILPTLPFIYALTARQISFWIKGGSLERIYDYSGFWSISKLYLGRIKRGLIILFLFIWALLSVISVWPYFLAYFSEIAGGPSNGYKYVVDSNLDWGQDILRLSNYIEANNIKEIKIDYFSGAPADYYIKTAKIGYYNRETPQKGWLAVSATILQGTCKGGKVPCSYNERAYTWLDQYQPVSKIGYSIFVYYLK